MTLPLDRTMLLSIAIGSLLPLAACSSLTVQVDVLRPEVVSARAESEAINRVMPQIVAEHDLSVDRAFGDLKNQHFSAYQDIRQQYESAAALLPANSQDRTDLQIAAQSLADGVASEINDLYDRTASQVKAVNAELRGYWTPLKTTTSAVDRESLTRMLLSSMAQRQALVSGAYEMFSNDLDGQISASSLTASIASAAAVARAATGARRTLKQLFHGGGFIDARYTYYVVKAEEDNWATMFDRTFARGFLGNTDIAIKALGPGNFTVKGLSFNPADVAAAASKVTTQTVLLAAQIAGVPVKVSGAPDTQSAGAALASSSTSLSNTLASSAQMEEKVRAHRDALLRIAASILQERDSVAGASNAERKAGLDAIRAVYASHASRLPITN